MNQSNNQSVQTIINVSDLIKDMDCDTSCLLGATLSTNIALLAIRIGNVLFTKK